ncbi:F-box-like/WD repeat-containing protein TBL1X [Platysternon megacephalum]|uniref:F-box-like/WD repeat-containing protein TBL1X n=1 Tax=Platysternon megacephalum TaxID=55544 RepID=A0A4D9DQV6_9SAUR|nr:F-box-like/WD repeat-containing protein TBL1X [Platysternon megacephalum]
MCLLLGLVSSLLRLIRFCRIALPADWPKSLKMKGIPSPGWPPSISCEAFLLQECCLLCPLLYFCTNTVLLEAQSSASKILKYALQTLKGPVKTRYGPECPLTLGKAGIRSHDHCFIHFLTHLELSANSTEQGPSPHCRSTFSLLGE